MTAPVTAVSSRNEFGSLVRPGETLEQALDRVNALAGPRHIKVIGSPEGQALLEAVNAGRGAETPAPAIGDNPPAQAAAFPPVAAAPSSPAGSRILEIPLERIDVGTNVRVTIAEVEELAASIAEHGVLQPVKALRMDTGGDRPPAYRLVWGQRRVLAARLAGLTTVPAIVLDGDETSLTEDAAARSIEQLVENLHRADLNPIDRAEAIRQVVDAGTSQADLARKLGVAPSTVSNDLRLLETAPKVQELLRAGTLTPAHAKAFAGLDPEDQAELAVKAIDQRWSAHEAERQAKWAKDAEGQRRRNRELAVLHTADAIRLLEKVANRKRSTISVPSYGGRDVRDALAADGWNVTDKFLAAVPEPGACGCAGVWRLEVPYNEGGVELRPACNSAEHEAARRAERDAQWERERARNDAARTAAAQAAAGRTERREAALRPHVATLPPELARALVFLVAEQLDATYGEELVERHAPEGTEDAPDVVEDPWTEVVAVLSDDDARTEAARALAVAIEAFAPAWRPNDPAPARDAIDEWLGIAADARISE